MIQAIIAFMGIVSLILVTTKGKKTRLWGSIIGFLAQPVWMKFAIDVDAWGLIILSVAYMAVYIKTFVQAFLETKSKVGGQNDTKSRKSLAVQTPV